MSIIIKSACADNIEEIAQLYDSLNDYLTANVNYPGWKKGVYPTREDAEKGIMEGSLYAAWDCGKIVGSIILNHEPEYGYDTVDWNVKEDYSKIYVIRTLAVHPDHLKKGIGAELLRFSIEQGQRDGMKALRLDVYHKNSPAIKLYEKLGFTYVDTADLGYASYGLDYFKLYERCL
jgi:ribosomal protein S18 acetylase RimI-like enzyme